MNKQITVFLLALGLMMLGQVTIVDAGMTEDKANMSASDRGDTGEGAYMGYCLPCHGMDGTGNGPLADSLGEGIVPRNFTDGEYMSSRTDEELFKVIKFGGKKSGFSDAMPDWGYNFPDADIKAIVQYIRSDLCKCKYKAD
ncbi:MAG: cytochrome c [Mariprofundus sp.]|nr:cytochrome c [Mariprofundus sp.]